MSVSVIVMAEDVTGPQAEAVELYALKARAAGLSAEEVLEDLAAQGLLAADVPLHASVEDGRLTLVVGC